MRVDYGVRALVELAQRVPFTPMQTSEIAERQKIPEAYLEQLLSAIHREGIIKSRRGPQGGHFLAKEPEQIDLKSVVVALEGNSPPLDCFAQPTECIHSYNCAQKDVWRTVEDAIDNVLSTTTIADLANRQKQGALQKA
jgi:Rrf2 family protein